MTTRQYKMTQAQKLALVEELEKPENKFVIGPLHPSDADNARRKWDEISSILNSLSGPMKTGDKWKKTFIELRCHINKKARAIMLQREKGAGPEAGPLELSDIDERIFNLSVNKSSTQEDCFEEFVEQEDDSEQQDDIFVEIPFLMDAPDPDPLQSMPSSSGPHKTSATSPRRSAASWRDRRKLKSVKSVFKSEQAKQAVETFASAAQMQADALQQIATAMHRIASVQEQSSLRLINVLDKLVNSVVNGAKK